MDWARLHYCYLHSRCASLVAIVTDRAASTIASAVDIDVIIANHDTTIASVVRHLWLLVFLMIITSYGTCSVCFSLPLACRSIPYIAVVWSSGLCRLIPSSGDYKWYCPSAMRTGWSQFDFTCGDTKNVRCLTKVVVLENRWLMIFFCFAHDDPAETNRLSVGNGSIYPSFHGQRNTQPVSQKTCYAKSTPSSNYFLKQTLDIHMHMCVRSKNKLY